MAKTVWEDYNEERIERIFFFLMIIFFYFFNNGGFDTLYGDRTCHAKDQVTKEVLAPKAIRTSLVTHLIEKQTNTKIY